MLNHFCYKQTLAKQEPIYFLLKTEKTTAPRIISARKNNLHNDFETENIGSCIRVVFAAIPVVSNKRRKATWCWLAQVVQRWNLSFPTMLRRVFKQGEKRILAQNQFENQTYNNLHFTNILYIGVSINRSLFRKVFDALLLLEINIHSK